MALSFYSKRLLLRSSKSYLNKRHNGFIVLVPEIGEDVPEKNSLLRSDGLPEFNTITVEKCIAAVTKYTLDYEDEIKNIEKNIDNVKNVFADIFAPLEHLDCPLELTWGVAKTLYLGNSSLMPTKTYMQIHERVFRATTTKYRSPYIYKAMLKAQQDEKSLTEEEIRLLKKYVTEGKLNGLDITDSTKRDTMMASLKGIEELRKEFRDKVDFATKYFSHDIQDGVIVRDFPPKLLKEMAVDPNDPTRGPWKIRLTPNIYEGFLEYCPDKLLRWNAWQAYNQRSSGYNNKEVETSTVLEKIRDHRHNQANILGFKTFADMSMETKMAGSVDNVKQVLNKLLHRARPMQDVELEKLEIFAAKSGFNGTLEAFDVPYWKRKQMKNLYNYAEEDTRDYFPLPIVLQGLFDLSEKLFDIQIVERSDVDTWHKDVKFYEIFESDSRSPIAGFYLDPYARDEGKIKMIDNTGWMLAIRNRSAITESNPLATLIFNFQMPLYGKPSLLSFREVNALFHKFGHALRHLLTETNYSDVAGISNVEWDAADVCGHVMTHWLYNANILKSISSHYTTQESLPDDIINSIFSIRKHMSGYELSKELYLAALDLELHSSKTFWRDIVRDLWPKYHTLPFNKNNAHPCSFTKIFSEEWAAAYYCQVWSRMIAADIYGAFYDAQNDENIILEVGRRYRDTFLASGGSCHSNETFRRFRGRDPSHTALLHTLGLMPSDEQSC